MCFLPILFPTLKFQKNLPTNLDLKKRKDKKTTFCLCSVPNRFVAGFVHYSCGLILLMFLVVPVLETLGVLCVYAAVLMPSVNFDWVAFSCKWFSSKICFGKLYVYENTVMFVLDVVIGFCVFCCRFKWRFSRFCVVVVTVCVTMQVFCDEFRPPQCVSAALVLKC